MKADNVAIGRRVRGAIDLAFDGELKQAEIAQRVSMTPDALSRALRGERGFASVELVELADLTGSDLHELITGDSDPRRLRVVARHDYEHGTGRRSVAGREADETVLDDIGLVYRQAGAMPPTPDPPGTVEELRSALGEDFVRPFADRVEQRLGIDIVRVRELSTCYSFAVDGRLVIAVDASGNWFRENFGIAHELGHIARRHHDEQGVVDRHEAAANDFAAQLLLPPSLLETVDWTTVDDDRLADLVWSYGVSTLALHLRLGSLHLDVSDVVEHWAQQPTQRLLRRHLRATSASDTDVISARMDDASTRRFPLGLRAAHLRRIAAGELGKGSLAWMLGVDAESLDVDAPTEPSTVDPQELGDLLGLASS